MRVADEDKLIVFFDYEGTLGTSIRRHYAQYCEALSSIGRFLKLESAPELLPVRWEEFRERYRAVRGMEDYLPVSSETSEGKAMRAHFKKVYNGILWEYREEHLALEELLPECGNAVERLAGVVRPVMISYTRQDQGGFVNHLSRLGLVAGGRFRASDILCVGTDGRKGSREAKREAMETIYAEALAAQKRAGRVPLYVGDSVDDFLAASDAAVGFIAVTETGKGHAEDFEAAAAELRRAGVNHFLRIFPRLSAPECVAFITRCAEGPFPP